MTKLVNSTIYLIGTGEVAKAALNTLVKKFPTQPISVVSSNTSGGLLLFQKMTATDTNLYSQVSLHQIDVYRNTEELKSFIKNKSQAHKEPAIIFNLGSPYLDMVLMNVALDTKSHYVDTACYEELDTKGFTYKDQLALSSQFTESGLKAIIGAGGSPGVTNALVRLHDAAITSNTVKIYDYNGGSQDKYPWATNFAAEDNLKELDNPAAYLEDGQWREETAFTTREYIIDPLSVGKTDRVVFSRIYHEEQETIHMAFPHIENIQNYMSFGDDYIKYFKLFRDLGLLGVDPISDGSGGTVIPIRFLASLMPHPRDVAALVKGPAGMIVKSTNKTGGEMVSIWSMDHQTCMDDTDTGAVAWSTGVPACLFMDALIQLKTPGVFTPETLPNLSRSLWDSLRKKYGLEIYMPFASTERGKS